jgi:hypothetical protein
MPKTVHFSSKAGYQKWLAYGHIHKRFHGCMKIVIGGHTHKVKHSHPCRRG